MCENITFLNKIVLLKLTCTGVNYGDKTHSSASRVVTVILLLVVSQWRRVTGIGGVTGITKHFRLRWGPWLTEQLQHHEIQLKCHCLYTKCSWPEAILAECFVCSYILPNSLQEKSPTVTPAVGWSVEQGKPDLGCSAAGSVTSWWAGQRLQPTQLHLEESNYLHFLWEHSLDLENFTFLSSLSRQPSKIRQVSPEFFIIFLIVFPATMTKVWSVLVASFCIHMGTSMDVNMGA